MLYVITVKLVHFQLTIGLERKRNWAVA